MMADSSLVFVGCPRKELGTRFQNTTRPGIGKTYRGENIPYDSIAPDSGSGTYPSAKIRFNRQSVRSRLPTSCMYCCIHECRIHDCQSHTHCHHTDDQCHHDYTLPSSFM